MERRQNGGRRRYIVQQFVLTITDDAERLVCYLFMGNYTEGQILRQLHLSQARLEAIKLKLAIELRQAGIENLE